MLTSPVDQRQRRRVVERRQRAEGPEGLQFAIPQRGRSGEALSAMHHPMAHQRQRTGHSQLRHRPIQPAGKRLSQLRRQARSARGRKLSPRRPRTWLITIGRFRGCRRRCRPKGFPGPLIAPMALTINGVQRGLQSRAAGIEHQHRQRRRSRPGASGGPWCERMRHASAGGRVQRQSVISGASVPCSWA